MSCTLTAPVFSMPQHGLWYVTTQNKTEPKQDGRGGEGGWGCTANSFREEYWFHRLVSIGSERICPRGRSPPEKNGILCILGTSLLVQRTALGAGGAQPLVGPLEKMCFSGRRGGPNTSGPLEKKKFSLRAGGPKDIRAPPPKKEGASGLVYVYNSTHLLFLPWLLWWWWWLPPPQIHCIHDKFGYR